MYMPDNECNRVCIMCIIYPECPVHFYNRRDIILLPRRDRDKFEIVKGGGVCVECILRDCITQTPQGLNLSPCNLHFIYFILSSIIIIIIRKNELKFISQCWWEIKIHAIWDARMAKYIYLYK